MKRFTIFILALLFFLIVHCIPIRRMWLIGISTAIAVSTFNIEHCSAQWYQITLPVSGSVYKMQFINSNTGWAVVNTSNYVYVLIRTTNQGTNWFVIYSDSAKVETFQFINDTLGYALGESHGFSLLSKTTNSGYNWTVMQSSFSDIYDGFYMINADTGWVNAFSVPTTITLRTTNGFQTLEYISSGGGGTPATLYFFKEKYNGEYCGYMLGEGLFKTTNSGYNWQQISFSGFGNVNSFSFINKDTGWVVYLPSVLQNSQILFTTNSGQNWTQQFLSNIQGDFGYIQAVTKNKLWCGKSSYFRILITTNGGMNWGYQSSPINTNMGVYFYDTLLGFSWSDYQIARTTNGGGPITQIINNKEQIASNFILYQNYPNPFNPTTKINYELPKDGRVKLVIYDILGREIKTLVNELKQAGRYTVEFNGNNYASGVYFYRILVEGGKSYTSVKKMVLIK
jgi:photosystem II stability/assembly factor-like uncharacterized protein